MSAEKETSDTLERARKWMDDNDEAQAPTTAALTEAVYAWVRDDLSIGAKMTIGFFIQRLIDRLAVVAPAPATTHARQCGYWLDLNCSCKLKGDTP